MIDIKIATGQNLDLNKLRLAATVVGKKTLVSDRVEGKPEGDEAWRVVAEWDASHSVPKRGDGQRINNPELVAWSPSGEEIVTACDAFGLTLWTADGRRIGGGTDPYAYGSPTRFFWSPSGELVLLEAQTAQTVYWHVQDRNGNIIRWLIASGGPFHSWGSDSMESYGFHRTRCFSPWRPGRRQLLVERGGPRLDLIDIMDLPTPPNSSTPAFVARVVGWLVKAALRLSPDKTLADVRAVSSVSLERLGTLDGRIMRYAWDPSGQYVAVTTGHPDDRSVRRVHILHYETGEIVATIPPTTTALGWSPGGRLLFCQRWIDAYGDNWTIESVVWDSHTWSLRDISEEEREQPWALQYEFSRLGN